MVVLLVHGFHNIAECGLRYEMEENGNLVQFIFNQDREVVAEEDNSDLNRLIRGTELIASCSSADSARTYYHYASDEMGSVTHIVDEAGAVRNRYEYDAWGNITAREEQIPNRFTYYGQQIDPVTQQYYLRARFYNPVVGRFTQEDTYRGDGLNLYVYCGNNPIYYIDPNGYASISPDELTRLLNSGSQSEIFTKLWSLRTEKLDAKLATGNYIDNRGLLPNELLVGTYDELNVRPYGWRFDDISPHHMPGASTLIRIPTDSGSCLNITTAAHRLTFTFGRTSDDPLYSLYSALSYENRLLFDQGDVADIYEKTRKNVEINLVNLALEEQRQHAISQAIHYKEALR